MHLAIGARNESMIRWLKRQGANFEAPVGPTGKKTTSPVFWLVNEHWLRRSGEPEDVVRILRVLKDLGWDVRAKLNFGGKTLRDLVDENVGDRVGLRNAMLEEL